MLPVDGWAISSAGGPGAARRGRAAGGWCWATRSAPLAIMLQADGREILGRRAWALRAAATPPGAGAGRPGRRRT
jgi:hypothetical protein